MTPFARKTMHEIISLLLYLMFAAGVCAASLYLYWEWPRLWGFLGGMLLAYIIGDYYNYMRRKKREATDVKGR